MPLMKFGQQKSFPTTWIERWMKGCGDPRVEEETGGRPMMEKWKNGGNFRILMIRSFQSLFWGKS